MMKYVVCAAPMLFSIEWLSWICLAILATFAILDLAMKIDEEKGDRW